MAKMKKLSEWQRVRKNQPTESGWYHVMYDQWGSVTWRYYESDQGKWYMPYCRDDVAAVPLKDIANAARMTSLFGGGAREVWRGVLARGKR